MNIDFIKLSERPTMIQLWANVVTGILPTDSMEHTINSSWMKTKFVAKGFNLTIDETEVSSLDNDSINKLLKSIENRPVHINLIQDRLRQFKIKHVTYLPDSKLVDRVAMTDQRDSIFYADILPTYGNDRVFREISYFNWKGN